MPLTPDRSAGTLDEEEVLFEDRTTDGDPTDERAMRYVGGEFRMKDSIGVFNPRDAAVAAHEFLDTLNHFVVETSFHEYTRDDEDLVTNLTIWTTPGKTLKMRELSVSRDDDDLVDQIIEIQYDGAGTEKYRLQFDLTRDDDGLISDIQVTRI